MIAAMRIPFLNSPHCNARPDGTSIDLIVLHAISLPPGQFGTSLISDFFMGELDISHYPELSNLEHLRVSAHFVVNRQGDITQFVPLHKRAWHAGESSWQGRGNCNDYSIGIEMIGDEQTPFTPAQYRETARLCRVLMQRFLSITPDRIVGHRDVAPERKWDPGRQWQWQRFHRSLAGIRKLALELME